MYKIDKTKCNGCGDCVEACPYDAIEVESNGRAKIHIDKCKLCHKCVHVCRMGAIKEE